MTDPRPEARPPAPGVRPPVPGVRPPAPDAPPPAPDAPPPASDGPPPASDGPPPAPDAGPATRGERPGAERDVPAVRDLPDAARGVDGRPPVPEAPSPAADPPPAPAGLRVADLDGLAVGVWGAGREGAAALRALATHAPRARALVVTSTAPPADEPALPSAPDGTSVARAHGPEGIAALAACDVVIRSPGVPVRGPEADAVRAGGARITTGTALWMAERGDRETVVGVTGTKGKSTTSSLLHALLGVAGARSRLAGNIGRPLLDELDAGPDVDVWVLELSSYQLADLPQAPTLAVVTNLLRDHLPWHGSQEAYHRDKLRILTAGDGPRLAVLPWAEEPLRAAGERLDCPVLWTGRPGGLRVQDAAIRDGDAVLARLEDLPLRGVPNALNLVAAIETVRALAWDPGDLRAALRGFTGLPHRQEVVAEAGGVRWVSDSISTTPEAALAAMAAFAPGPLVLLAGGDDREQRYGPLVDALVRGAVPTTPSGSGPSDEVPVEVAGVVGLPGTGAAICAAVADASAAVGRAVPTVVVEPGEPDAVMGDAVDAAARLAGARPAVTVLLSPAAPSHNVFRDFTDRGARFAAAAARAGATDASTS